MNRTRQSVERQLAIGVLCAMALTGCADGLSPTSPSQQRAAPGGNAMAAPSVDIAISQRAMDGLQTLGGGSGAQNRWVACYPATGGYVQLSVHAMGMSAAVRYCLVDLNGRIGGVVRPPLP